MEKIVRTFIFLLLTCTVLFAATNYTRELENYDAQMKNASNDEMLRVFYGLKSVYIHAIISNDDELKRETLERLIKSAKFLKIDASKYESELALMSKNSKKTFNEDKSLPIKKEVESVALPMQKSFNERNTLQKATMNEDEIILEFDNKINENDTKIFILKSADSYKKVFDIPAIMTSSISIATPKKLRYLKISQYNKDLLRVVLESPKEFEATGKVFQNKIVISLGKHKEKDIQDKIDKNPKKAEVVLPQPLPLVTNTTKRSKRDKIVVIDAGHGGEDAGATGYKQKKEKHLVLDIALQLGKTLKENGYKVFYTRDKDFFIQLRDRTKMANDKNADLFISVHANAAPNESKQLSMKGIETFFLSPDRSERSKSVAALENKSTMEEMDLYSKETFLNVFNREKIILSNKAAIDIQSGMLKSVKSKYDVGDGGVREAPFWVLVGATMPSILVEVGYITNPDESDKLFNPQYQKLLVDGIMNGIDKYFVHNP